MSQIEKLDDLIKKATASLEQEIKSELERVAKNNGIDEFEVSWFGIRCIKNGDDVECQKMIDIEDIYSRHFDEELDWNKEKGYH